MGDAFDDFISDMERAEPYNDFDYYPSSSPLIDFDLRRPPKQSNPFRKKVPMPVKPLLRNCAIVGNKHRDENAQAVFAGLKVEEPLDLHLEPTNEFDAFAVKVLVEGVHIGYVPREMSAVLHAMSTNGKDLGDDVIAIVSEVGTKGGVRMTIGLAE